jgi:hypothetical protein
MEQREINKIDREIEVSLEKDNKSLKGVKT